MKRITSLFLLAGAVLLFAGCTALNPRTLTKPVPTPEAAFKYRLHVIEDQADGSTRAADGDTIEVDQTALKDNWSINLDRSYYDTTQMPIEAVRSVSDVLKIHATTGNQPSREQLALYAGALTTAANYSIPLVLKDESADVQRSNDPEAFAAARVAQFNAAADLAKFQTNEARRLAQTFTPYGAATGAFDTLAGLIAAKQAQPATPATPPPDETPADPAPEPEPNP